VSFSATPIASTYHQVKVGCDAAALKGVMKAIIARADGGEDALDRNFLAAHTNGFEAFADDLRQTPWEAIETASGLTRGAMDRVADAYVRSNATIVSYGMGITQHEKGTQNVQQIAALLLMRGNFGKPGAGICPLRGHSNVQGNRTVGITEKVDPVMFANVGKAFGFRPPPRHGDDAVGAMQAMVAGKAKALVCLGGNFSIALPDTDLSHQGMRNLDLAVHLNTKLNRSHLLIGKESILLPVLGRTERDIQATGAQSVTVEDSMSMVHASRGKLEPASEYLRSEPAIIAGIAMATLPTSKVDWPGLIADYDLIRDKIEAVYPDFKDYNARIRRPGGFRLPLAPTERVWRTQSGKAEFIPFTGLAEDPAMIGTDVLKLTTLRSHDQYNTTVYGLDDRYRGVFGRRDVLFISEQDLAAHNLAHGDVVQVVSAIPGHEHRRIRLTAIAHDIAPGSIGAYYPEANNLCPLTYLDPQSGTPSYKSLPVRLRKVA
jgi:molybdopterin-dependent oxidoreductase alpha subunit